MLPTLSAFEDWGRESDTIAEYPWPLTIRLLKPLDLPDGTKCVNVEAEISPVSRVRAVDPSDDRHLEFAAIEKPDGSEDIDHIPEHWDWVQNLTIKIISPFR